MSHASVAAAFSAPSELSTGERLAMYSLASFANGQHRAWPGTRIAAARAGLSRSQYLAARAALVRQGLIFIEDAGTGRGNSPLIHLGFVESGPRVEAEINAPLFEAVLSYSRSRGSARVLLAVLAAFADEDLRVGDLTTREICEAAGLADSTYRRARATLLGSGEVVVEDAAGGRSRTSRWLVCDPQADGALPIRAPQQRPRRPAGARPLIASARELPAVEVAAVRPAGTIAKGPELSGVLSLANPAQDRTVSVQNRPGLTGVSGNNPGQDRTLWAETPLETPPDTPLETPPKTPPETPSPYARAGREPLNQGTNDPPNPPNPPAGGSEHVTVVEEYLTDRGRRRRRAVQVPLADARSELRLPAGQDNEDWIRVRTALLDLVGESTFQMWFAELELIGVDAEDQLLLRAPATGRAWVASRFARVLDRAADHCGRGVRLADGRDIALITAIADASTEPSSCPSITTSEQEAV